MSCCGLGKLAVYVASDTTNPEISALPWYTPPMRLVTAADA